MGLQITLHGTDTYHLFPPHIWTWTIISIVLNCDVTRKIVQLSEACNSICSLHRQCMLCLPVGMVSPNDRWTFAVVNQRGGNWCWPLLWLRDSFWTQLFDDVLCCRCRYNGLTCSERQFSTSLTENGLCHTFQPPSIGTSIYGKADHLYIFFFKENSEMPYSWLWL